ncbi:flagellar assembly peptidoglycan hydrolase FlgJ [Novilysobacter arseniciresistens]|uniref:flagellar assembly peptidoglycan hydrolase FlgJ n=1 Tax=Novilysobacter arseniciresistens TaxID=1385522 RepID=UPI0006906983|nr:flagellar assembly peptidoglycan hydrolase FlgJ [Lysobacter arseniciresistens]
MNLQSATAMPFTHAAGPSRDRLREAARELETQFAQMMLKSMRSTGFGDPMLGDNTMYREMYDQQLAKEMARGDGLGLAPMIVRQLERSQGGGDVEATFATPGGLPLTRQLPMAMPLSAASPAMALSTGAAGLALAPSDSGVSLGTVAPLAAPSWPEPASPDPAMPVDPDARIDASSPEAFVRSIWPHAQRTAAELGVPARALVAQAALETGWGRRLVGGDGSHNLFGIKATGWNGAKVNSATHEFVGGVRHDQRDDFRAYGSINESFADYARLMRNDRYADALAAGDDTRGFANALQRAGYATDPSYAAKITAIANGPTLDRALASMPTRDVRNVAALPTTPRG